MDKSGNPMVAQESAIRAIQDEGRLNEERYRTLVQAVSTFTWVADVEGHFSAPQPGWQAYTGHDFEHHGHSGWIQDVHPEDRERVSQLWRNAVQNKTSYEVEWRCWHGESQTWRHCVTRGVPLLSPDGSLREWIGAVQDVEQQREEQLSRSHKIVSELVERAPFGIYVVDSEFRIAHMNAGSQTGAFRNVRPVIGRNFSEAVRILWPESVAAQVSDCFRHTLETGEPYYSHRFTHPRLDLGKVESYEWELHRMTLPNGSYGVICYYFDSSKLREAEAALRRSEERLSAELAAMTALQKVGALLVRENNLHTVLKQIVDCAIEISGADFGNIQLLNPTSHQLEIVAQQGFPQWWVDYWASVPEGKGSCGTALARGERIIVEDIEKSSIFAGSPALDIQRKAGVRAVLSIPLLNRSGTLLGMFSTHYKTPHSPDEHTLRFLDLLARHAGDIIARTQAEEALHRSEEHFRRLYESNIVGIVRADSERVIDSNDIFLEMVGYTREDLNAGRIRWREMTPPEHHRLDERALAELNTTGSCKPFEKELFRKNGGRVAILIGATVLDKSPLRWLAFAVDLTERKELERRLMEKQKLEGIGLLAGGVAHDFNNLLVALLGNASLAQEMVPETSVIGRLLKDIVKASERAAHLTRQMLAYSGKGQFIIEPVDLSDLVQEMTRLLHPSIPGNVSIHFELGRNLRPVMADAGQLQQVVTNLVVNAAEAIGEEPGSISLRTGMRTIDQGFIQRELAGGEIEPGKYVWLEVRDSGCGMDQATIAKIFDPFYTTKFTGRGLGLAAVSGIVRSHRGAIRVKSAPGEGTVFLVLFPAAPEAPIERKKKPGARDPELTGTPTILVVDDEGVVLRTARFALESRGYSILAAESGPTAIDLFRVEKERISLIVLDLSMPGMSGQQTLGQLRAIQPDVRVLVSSGYSEAEVRRVFEGADVQGFLQKPYTVAQLVEKVHAALSEPEGRDYHSG
jgi:PAS domain S-box-containing protein